jgi:hypothetical protein
MLKFKDSNFSTQIALNFSLYYIGKEKENKAIHK